MNELISILKHSDKNLIKGTESHFKLAPLINGEHFRTFNPSPDAYNSSVLLILREFEKKIQILFTLRSSNMKIHSGQISFPGGRVENSESYSEAALRETNEEIGILPEQIEIIKQLSPLYVPPSNTIIHPFVGILIQDSKFTLNPDEVEDAFWIDLEYFINTNNMVTEQWKFDGKIVDVPLWKIHPKQVLWGATAMILSEFIDIIKDNINFSKSFLLTK